MGLPRDLLLRFLLLYSTLYCSFGFSSPFLPAFLVSRGVDSEWLGFLLGAGTAVRLISAPVAGRFADVFGAFRLELALFSISAAMASLLYLPTHSFGLLILVNLIQAAMLAPLAPLSDARVGGVRIWLGARRRLRRLHCRRARDWLNGCRRLPSRDD
jgi:MFS transporter, PPP family, 3-phenylpropionic acid transporter